VANFVAVDAIFESKPTRLGNFRIQERLSEQQRNRKFPHAIALPSRGEVKIERPVPER
jgi:hypothetical protein